MAHVYISIRKQGLIVCRCLPTTFSLLHSAQDPHTDNPQLSPLCLQLSLANRDGEAGTGKSQRMGAQRRQVFLWFLQQAHYGFNPSSEATAASQSPLHSDP